MTKIKKLITGFWPTAIVIGVILYATLSSDPLGADEIPPIPHLDKLIHAVMMGGLFGSLCFDMQRADKSKALSRRCLIVTALVIMAFGGIDEIVQATMDNDRSGDWLDLAADWTGTWVAYFTAPPVVHKVLKMH